MGTVRHTDNPANKGDRGTYRGADANANWSTDRGTDSLAEQHPDERANFYAFVAAQCSADDITYVVANGQANHNSYRRT